MNVALLPMVGLTVFLGLQWLAFLIFLYLLYRARKEQS